MDLFLSIGDNFYRKGYYIMNNFFEAAAETIGDAAGLNQPQRRLVKMGLIVATVYVGARYLRSLVGRK